MKKLTPVPASNGSVSHVLELPGSSALSEKRQRAGGAFADDGSHHLREWMDREMTGLPRESAVLALGCEQAFVAPQLARYAGNVTVLDSSGGQIAQLAPRFPEIVFQQHAPTKAVPFPDGTFDAIWCCEYLDRVFDPASVLREFHRVLAPSGRLLLAVPDHGPVRSLLRALFKWEPPASAYPRVRYFTRTTLAIMARDTGWGEINVATTGAPRGSAAARFPRSLLLKARKGPEAEVMPVADPMGEASAESLWPELSIAGRGMAA